MSRRSLIIIAVAAVLAVVVGGAVLAMSGTDDHAAGQFNAKLDAGDGYSTTSGGVRTADPGKTYLVVTYTIRAADKLTSVGGSQDCYIDVERDGVTTRYTASAWDSSLFWGMKYPVDMEPGAVHSFPMVFYLPDDALSGSLHVGFGKNIRFDLDRELPVTPWTPYKPA